MRIDNLQSNVTPLLPGDAGTRTGDKTTGNATGGAADTLSLSSLTARLRQVSTQPGADDGINLDRINAMREAIQNGSYQINSAGIGAGMIEHIASALAPVQS
ncbi:MAG: flagellar biosynthesis anti-sigma factor FlgM [Thiobacillaceae bacterium]